RIASNMMRSAATDYAERGRLNELANLLDIEIINIEGNSTGVSALCTFQNPPGIQALFPYDIPERAGAELLESIERESNGQPYNSSIRKYLYSLPPLTEQKYEIASNGQPLHAPVVIKNVNLATSALLLLPSLIQFEGHIIGVGFEPGVRFVKIKTEDE